MPEYSVIGRTLSGAKFEPYRGRDAAKAEAAYDQALARGAARLSKLELWALAGEGGRVIRKYQRRLAA